MLSYPETPLIELLDSLQHRLETYRDGPYCIASVREDARMTALLQ